MNEAFSFLFNFDKNYNTITHKLPRTDSLNYNKQNESS